ncbi:MAG: M20/M25/M40 family metallo-hydrolase [Candidatus Solibacter usitatus]|nr:M20/M25/M40 family metallo-hydrolase [Candidatus Solibacter usitatus]
MMVHMAFRTTMTVSLLLAGRLVTAQESPGELARAVLKELVEINTTDSSGDNTAAAEAVARRLRAAGIAAEDVSVVVPAPKKGNLVARLRGTGRARPLLLLAHLDVVEARRSDWTMEPFNLTERDGYFYGRGTQDIKGDAALLVANLIRLKREGFRPERDIILALTADEEGGRGPNGAEWLLRNRRELIDAEFCVNTDAGGGQAQDGRRVLYSVQAAEKGYVSFVLTAKNAGGHSSLPRGDNAIYELAAALTRVKAMEFPVQLNEVTRGYFEKKAAIPAAPSEAVYENALRRTTCVATMLSGGHADNALPQTAEATVNCRALPGATQVEVEQRLQAAAGPGVDVRVKIPLRPNPASPPPAELMARVEKVVRSMWPDLPVVPVMETGGTDGKPLRAAGIPVYGIAQMFYDLDDIRAHGRDERIRTAYFYDGLEFGYRLIKALAGR